MNSLSVILLFTGVPVLIAALLWRKYPPSGISVLYGYRTTRSMINDDTWKVANAYSARLLLKVALGFLAVGLLFLPLSISDRVGVVTGLGLVVIGLGATIFFTEKHLTETFDDEGKRKGDQG